MKKNDKLDDALDVMYYRYSLKKEYGKSGNVIMTENEANLVYEGLRYSGYVIRTLQDIIKYENALEKEKIEIENAMFHRKDYIPPLDEFIKEQFNLMKRLEDYVIERKKMLLCHLDKLKNYFGEDV